MSVRVVDGDCRKALALLPSESVNCVVTSPPYFGLRDYGAAGQIGLEPTPSAYVAELVAVFREVRRVLRANGTVWLNLGDSYAAGGLGAGSGKQLTNVGSALGPKKAPPGYKAKDLLGIPWRVAFALQDDGWYLRSDIIWAKPNPMPESVTDRPTKSHEYVFLLSKSARYWFDQEAVKEPASENSHSGAAGRNVRSVWTIATSPIAEAHFATFPPELAERCIKAGCPTGGTVLDPFAGAGTTGLVADRLGRNALLIELNPKYAEMARQRITRDGPLFADVA